MIQFPAGLILGLAVGGVIGLAWGQATRSELSRHVVTEVDGQAVRVAVNYRDAAIAGLYSLAGFR